MKALEHAHTLISLRDYDDFPPLCRNFHQLSRQPPGFKQGARVTHKHRNLSSPHLCFLARMNLCPLSSLLPCFPSCAAVRCRVRLIFALCSSFIQYFTDNFLPPCPALPQLSHCRIAFFNQFLFSFLRPLFWFFFVFSSPSGTYTYFPLRPRARPIRFAWLSSRLHTEDCCPPLTPSLAFAAVFVINSFVAALCMCATVKKLVLLLDVFWHTTLPSERAKNQWILFNKVSTCTCRWPTIHSYHKWIL